jgi:hypothetical protein
MNYTGRFYQTPKRSQKRYLSDGSLAPKRNEPENPVAGGIKVAMDDFKAKYKL